MFAILGIEKHKSLAQLVSRCSHQLRTHAVPNADLTKAMHNACAFTGTAQELACVIWDRVEPLSRRKDSVRCIEVMLSVSPEFFDDQPNRQSSRLTNSAVQWLNETFGPENVAAVGLHRDEKTPHIWAMITPIEGGKLRASHWLDGPAKMQRLHTTWAKKLEPFGVKRGVQKSTAKHIDLRTYYASVNGDQAASAQVERELRQRLVWSSRRIAQLEARVLELETQGPGTRPPPGSVGPVSRPRSAPRL